MSILKFVAVALAVAVIAIFIYTHPVEKLSSQFYGALQADQESVTQDGNDGTEGAMFSKVDPSDEETYSKVGNRTGLK